MKRELLVLGPYDRYNYGDLLFARIIEESLKNYYDDIKFYSTTESDLTGVGGVKTRSFHELNNLSDAAENNLIVAGGESLFVTWGSLCIYVSPTFNKLKVLFRIVGKLFGEKNKIKFYNYVGRKWLKGSSYLPMSVSKLNFQNINKVYYNAVGGSHGNVKFIENNKHLVETFSNVDYLSVRDIASQKLLKKIRIESSIVPDSAILMSLVFNNLDQLVSERVLSFIKKNGDYCFFQINKKIGLKNEAILTKQLEKLYDKTNLRLCLCPIGVALGHEDQDALKIISERLEIPNILFDESVTIYDIMYLIAKSKLYIGSSLHGIITSMSFEVPYIGLEVLKVKSYLETWAPNGLNRITSIEMIADNSLQLLRIPRTILKENLGFQVECYAQSVKHLAGS